MQSELDLSLRSISDQNHLKNEFLLHGYGLVQHERPSARTLQLVPRDLGENLRTLGLGLHHTHAKPANRRETPPARPAGGIGHGHDHTARHAVAQVGDPGERSRTVSKLSANPRSPLIPRHRVTRSDPRRPGTAGTASGTVAAALAGSRCGPGRRRSTRCRPGGPTAAG